MMKRTICQALALTLSLSCLSSAASADAQAVPVHLRPADQGWISRVQDTLGNVTTLQARFRQTAPDGKVTTGTATLDRPGRMRFDYDSPSPLLLVANEGRVVFQDRSVDQVTVIPLDRTPLGLLLRPDLRLSGDVTVTHFEHENHQLRVTLERTDNPGEGNLTLVLSDAPLALLGWVVQDAQGQRTSIALSDIRTGSVVSPSLFVLPKAE